jgi:hypothetical protein
VKLSEKDLRSWIELFFKQLKQQLRIKTFVGTSAKAVRIRIWTALIAVLIIRYRQFRSSLRWAVSSLVALLRWNLFSRLFFFSVKNPARPHELSRKAILHPPRSAQ